MTLASILVFLGNLRGWKIIIILLTAVCLFLVPFLLGIRVGRGTPRHRR